MYTVGEYGRMIADDARTGAYSRALRAAIRPDSVVLDLGAGTGILSLIACKLGARRVYAIELADAIAVGRRSAADNGFADRIVFIRELSTKVELPEPVDVIVSDLRGVLPLFGASLVAIADARRRLLAPGGTMIPHRDTLWAALVDAPSEHARLVEPWRDDRYGLDMSAGRESATNAWGKAIFEREQLLVEPRCLSTIDYRTLESPNLAATIDFNAGQAGVAHGLAVWFDSELSDGVEFSNCPGRGPLIYGAAFFPWPHRVELVPGDRVRVALRADFTGSNYVWSWDSRVYATDADAPRERFRQSTFWGTPLDGNRLSLLAADHRPTLGREGRVDRFVLDSMDGGSSIEEIAQRLIEFFPSCAFTFQEAFMRVGALSETYSRRPGERD